MLYFLIIFFVIYATNNGPSRSSNNCDYSKKGVRVKSNFINIQSTNFKRNRYLFIKLNPNPAREKVSVQLYGLYSIKKIEALYIADLLGRKVLDGTVEARKHSDGAKSVFDLYISNLGTGSYLVVLQGDNFFRTKQFAIVK
jgi:hypothetical protein